MGGSGGGGFIGLEGLGGSSGTEGTDCSQVSFTTVPQLAAAQVNVTEGQLLEVALADSGTGTAIILLDDQGDLAGVVSDNVLTLIGCLKKGVAFVASVQAAEDFVEVLVRPATIKNIEESTFNAPLDATAVSRSVHFSDGAVTVLAEDGAVAVENRDICEIRALLRVGVNFAVAKVLEDRTFSVVEDSEPTRD